MPENQPTTDRARRLDAVQSGQRETAIERRDSGVRGGGQDRNVPSRSRQNRAAREIANEIDVSREGVGTVDRLEGLDVFLRSSGTEQFSENVTDGFAGEADFVQPSDVNPNVDPEAISADPAVAPGRRDDVAARARRRTASDAAYIQAEDLNAEVGPRGVSELGVAAGRRDDVAMRAAQGLASESPFAEPGDFGIDVGESGITDAGLTDTGERRVVARQFESETPLSNVDPSAGLAAAGDGFELAGTADDRLAARRFESDIGTFGSGELDPESDIRDTDEGFALAEGARRQVAAARLDEQVTETDVGPG
ncbi:hypothetical protein KM295_14135, partial [Natronomonas sp. F2-12]